jgi:spore germination protein YaaH
MMMRVWRHCAGVAFLFLAMSSILDCAGGLGALPPPPRMGAWLTSWDLARGLDRAELSPTPLDDVLLFLASLTPSGRPTLDVSEVTCRDAVGRMRARGASVWLTIVNDVRGPKGTLLKDGVLVQRIFADPTLRRLHVQEIANLAEVASFSGVDIDYESVPVAARDDFTSFMRELATELHSRGQLLCVTAAPKRRESSAAGPGALDWAQLGKVVDRLQIMLYNQHSDKSGPGPIATPAWISEVMRFAESQSARASLVPVLKVSGMDWGPSSAEGVQYDTAMSLAQRFAATVLREQDSNVPNFTYEAAGERHTVYFEDAASIGTKVEVLKHGGYRGIVLWSLGREDPALLPLLLPSPTPTPTLAQKP